MAPLIILIVSYLTILAINKFSLKSRYSKFQAGRAAMSIMLVATGIAHFTNTGQMVDMLPDFIPNKAFVVYATGVLELIAALGLLSDRFARPASILLIVFFICILPANIIGSIKEVALGGMENGPSYLYFRVPLQIFFIWWVYYHGIRQGSAEGRSQ